MSAARHFVSSPSAQPTLQVVSTKSPAMALTALRLGFWGVGLIMAVVQAWTFRYQVTADSVSYLDMSDGVFPGSTWHRLINGVWSPLYPLLLGGFREVTHVSPANEIVAAHLLNIVFFVFAFVCFEFFLKHALSRLTAPGKLFPAVTSVPRTAYLALGYSLFLWAALSGITLRYLRPDMLMSGFVYLAIGLLIKMHGEPVRWRDHITLGVVLGIAVLAKEVMLPIGFVILLAALLIVENSIRALKTTAASLAIMVAIAGLYFVPLSVSRHSFTLGESGRYNYLLHVDGISPRWYPIHQGVAEGAFVRRPEQIFSTPPAYAFPERELVTHPLRFDPSEWVQGLRPHFDVKRQFLAAVPNFRILGQLQLEIFPVIVAAGALILIFWRRLHIKRFKDTWPLWIVGLIGCAIYVPVHIEPRYVTEFIVLFWIGVFSAFWDLLPLEGNTSTVLTALAGVLLLLPMAAQSWHDYVEFAKTPNEDAYAAAELAKLGIRPGDQVARLSASAVDLGVERIARVEIAAEVDRSHAYDFWNEPASIQSSLLTLFSSRGIKAVIATIDDPRDAGRPGWVHLGSTQYWVWLPASAPHVDGRG